jgi:hypothetical protein
MPDPYPYNHRHLGYPKPMLAAQLADQADKKEKEKIWKRRLRKQERIFFCKGNIPKICFDTISN